MTEKYKGIITDGDDYIEVSIGVSQWQLKNGSFILEEDYRVDGEIWRVHKNDPDPFPSKPHAHCIGGTKRFVGCKLHLGSAQLYKDSMALNRFLDPKQFSRLIELIKPKFPDITLPLPS